MSDTVATRYSPLFSSSSVRGAVVGPAFGWSSKNGEGGWGGGVAPVLFFGRNGPRRHAALLPLFAWSKDASTGRQLTAVGPLACQATGLPAHHRVTRQLARRWRIAAPFASAIAHWEHPTGDAERLGADGRLVLFSSGQRLGPMPGELAYAASKAAVENLTFQLSPLLMARGITVNCVNPGPVDTGYLTGADHAAVAAMFPDGRWGTPERTALLVDWLCSADAGWITGQVIDSEGGFNRYR